MKTQLLSLFMLLAGTIDAQTYQPFPSSGIAWREDHDGLSFNCCCSAPQSTCLLEDNYQHILQGDTTIGAYTYHKIYRSGYRDEYLYSTSPYVCPTGCVNYNPEFYGNMYVGALRQDIAARKVYFHPAAVGSQDTLLYDFNLQVGDYLPETYNTEANVNLVSEIDSVLIGNVYHRRYWLDYTNHPPKYAAIIEGIGSTYGLFFQLVPPFEFQTQLVCVKIDNLPVYPDSQTICSLSNVSETTPDLVFSFIPNPVQNISTLQVDANFEGAQLIVFTGTGQEVSRQKILNQTAEINRSNFSPGVYFFKVTNEKGQSGTGKFVIED